VYNLNNLLTEIVVQTLLGMVKLLLQGRLPAIQSEDIRDSAGLIDQLLHYGGLIETEALANADLHFNLAPELPLVAGDEKQLQTAILILLTNAAEALKGDRGAIVMATEPKVITAGSDGNRFVGDTQLDPGTYVCLSVSDTGEGMAKESLTRIFDPFFSTRAPGRGLGLPELLAIVRTHRGGVKVSSRPGYGSMFQMYLPAFSAVNETVSPSHAQTVASATLGVSTADTNCRQGKSIGDGFVGKYGQTRRRITQLI
jgi:signal transduction histidine kinase